MTQEEFNNTNWHRGNVVKLKNGKEYLCKGTKGHGKYLLLYSLEYDSTFVADYKIVDSRISDYEEPDEVYLEKKRKHQEEVAAKREAERQEYLRAKAERKQKNIEAQERAHQEAVARKAAAKALRQQCQEKKETKKPAKGEAKPEAKVVSKPQPKPVDEAKDVKPTEPAPAPQKRIRQRIKISSASLIREKVNIFKK